MRSKQRKEELIAYARQEAREVKIGQRTAISSLTELAQRFGYDRKKTVKAYLERANVASERRLAIREIQDRSFQETLRPSDSLAWILGFLSGGGYVNVESGEISSSEVVGADESALLRKFKQVGEELFQIESTDKMVRRRLLGKDVEKVSFYSRDLTRRIGSLER